MKVLYSYIAGIDPIFFKEGFRVLMTFKDDDNTFVFFVDDSNSNASIARVKSTRFAGYSMDNSLMFMMVMNVGAVVGIVGGGILADRFHLKPVLMFLGIMGAIVMSLMGFMSNQFLLYILVFLAGAASIGSQMLLYSYVAQYYPLAVRSTGIGWSSAIGRMGAIVGPIMIGALLGMNLPAHFNFMAVGLPVLITAIAVALIMSEDEAEKINASKPAVAEA